MPVASASAIAWRAQIGAPPSPRPAGCAPSLLPAVAVSLPESRSLDCRRLRVRGKKVKANSPAIANLLHDKDVIMREIDNVSKGGRSRFKMDSRRTASSENSAITRSRPRALQLFWGQLG